MVRPPKHIGEVCSQVHKAVARMVVGMSESHCAKPLVRSIVTQPQTPAVIQLPETLLEPRRGADYRLRRRPDPLKMCF